MGLAGCNCRLLKFQLWLVDSECVFCYDGAKKEGGFMTLGERIAAFRNAQKLSQGDLAEKLNVSRQSVSKWETNTSVPELDKLLQLSELFGVTLDELVRGNTAEEKTAPEPVQTQVIVQQTMNTQKIIGLILLATALFIGILSVFFGAGLLFASGYFLFCSLVCLLMKRYAGLVIGWVTSAALLFLTPIYTAIHPLAVFYSGGWSVSKVLAWAVWGLNIFMFAYTVALVRRKKK